MADPPKMEKPGQEVISETRGSHGKAAVQCSRAEADGGLRG